MTGRALGLGTLLSLVLYGCQSPLEPQRFVGTGNPLEPRPLAPQIPLVRPPGGDAAAQVRGLQARLVREPQSMRAHLAYVAGLTRLGRRAQARSWYQARVSDPGASQIERVMAARLESHGGSSALRRVYAAAAQAEPHNAWWVLGLAEVDLAEGLAWNARRRDASERSDRDAERTAYEQALAAAARAGVALERARTLPDAPPERLLYLGHLRALEGDLARQGVQRTAAFAAAAAAFEEAVALAPDLVEAWEGLGDARYRLGEAGASLHAFLNASQRAPGDGRLREALGVALHEAGREREAGDQYAAAAALLPHDPMPLLRLGDALAAQSRWEEALRAWDRALERDAQAAVEAHARQASVYEHLGRREEARLAYERYVDGGGERESFARRRIDRLLRGDSP